MMCKAISLLQPWASLVVMGAKKVETRPWNTTYRGKVLIHASLGQADAKKLLEVGASNSLFKDYLRHWTDLPFGAVIGVVELVETFQFGSDRAIEYFTKDVSKAEAKREFTFGDYTEGRYGFRLANPYRFKEPVPMKGALSLWNCDIRDEIVREYNLTSGR